LTIAPVESRNVCTNTMFSAILAVLFAIKVVNFLDFDMVPNRKESKHHILGVNK